MSNGKNQLVRIDIPPHLKVGSSSNVIRVTTTSAKEVMIDFSFLHPQDRVEEVKIGTLVARIVLSLSAARDLQMLLSSQIGKIKKE